MSKDKKKEKPKKREAEINLMALSVALRRPVSDFWKDARNKYKNDNWWRSE